MKRFRLFPASHLRSQALWLLISLAILILVGLLAPQHQLLQANHLVQDFVTAKQQHELSEKVIIIAIDDDSVQSLGRWPWRRSLHAELVRRISADQPAAIGLDILFTEADSRYPKDDEILSAAIQDSGVVTLPLLIQQTGPTASLLPPQTMLAESAASLGHVHIKIDHDGTVRSTYMQDEINGTLVNHFSLAILQTAQHPINISSITDQERSPLFMPSSSEKLRDRHEMLIPYAGHTGYFPRISYKDVIEDKLPADTFRGKIVLVGATATGIGDQYATPVSGEDHLMPGVEILANMVEGLLSGHTVNQASDWQNVLFNLAFVALALIGFNVLSPLLALLLTVTLLTLLLFSTYLIANVSGLLMAPAAGVMGLIVIYPLWSWHRLDTATRFLTAEFESFKTHSHLLFGAQKNPLFKDFLDRRISALEGAANELQSMHRFMTDSINGLPDPTLICDTTGIIRISNQAAARYFETNDAENLHQQQLTNLIANIRHPQSQQALITAHTLQQPIPAELAAEARDAKQRDLLIKFVPCMNAANQHIGWILSIIDVSQLWQAERDRDEAFRFITHDIRSPLSSIISLVELQKFNPGENEERLLNMIEKHADNALELADNFVQLTRAKSGHYQLHDLNLTDMLHEVIDEFWIKAYSRHITIKLEQAPTEARAMIDRTLFKRAIANLLSNAIKFSPDQSTISCMITCAHNDWHISVKDAGIGIDPALQPQLFQSFSRLHHQSHPEIEGTGLGLAFVHTVAIRHQGSASVESAPGQGSTFSITIPSIQDGSTS
ncbi:CHASE2 and HATPase_c domain-containing protein [Methylobacillus gramineus]|uniref:CHASE2 and HATPase_c domain-containing protein n=1 Tax=Methylobacillus gramineus TaxID=755169 RepID=UPI001D000F33|nr:CHASE2 and HATPase_c domain-containing protein [Methylobacillus gramineus]MCB5185243.1 CHASE2 and HATPase_c domain-containing protein [Methylobacillus gramineus]